MKLRFPFLSQVLFFLTCFLCGSGILQAQDHADTVCPRPQEGAVVQDPPSVRSQNGVLAVHLRFKQALDKYGNARYCYLTDTGEQSPTLRLAPGDKLAIQFDNNLTSEKNVGMHEKSMVGMASEVGDTCHGAMTAKATNLHFHGLVLPAVCHQDESIHTLIAPGRSFDYSIQIPSRNPPGLYWYHPHPHGYSTAQVQGGATGAMIIEGMSSVDPALKSLPERTFVLRDQLMPPDQAKSDDPLKPSWDISINYVPVRFPKYVPAVIQTAPEQKQFWRVVNSAANTIFHLQVISGGKPVSLYMIAVDGVPLAIPAPQTTIFLPPGSRAEFVIQTPAVGEKVQLVTQKHDPGPAGDSAPARPIANIVAVKNMRVSVNVAADVPIDRDALPKDLRGIKPVTTQNLYFSQNGNGTEGGAGAADKFYLTALSHSPKLFDMDDPPNIVVHQGTVEDWVLVNPTPEDHIFHIHQTHFQLIEVNGIPVNDPILRDTILVPHQVGRTPISSIRVRMDFRDPNIVGTFVYHCHILDHEDKGMMGTIQILPAEASSTSGDVASHPLTHNTQ